MGLQQFEPYTRKSKDKIFEWNKVCKGCTVNYGQDIYQYHCVCGKGWKKKTLSGRPPIKYQKNYVDDLSLVEFAFVYKLKVNAYLDILV